MNTLEDILKQARQIIWRYRLETPLGNQPHMIAHEADETVERIDQVIARAEGTLETEKQKPLTDEEIDQAWRSCDYTVPWRQQRIDIARAIEAAHNIKGES